MQFVNSSAWPTPMLKRLVTWTARQLGAKKNRIRKATFRKPKGYWGNKGYSGRACGTRFRVSCGTEAVMKARVYGGAMGPATVDGVETLVYVTAHEMAHCEQYQRLGSHHWNNPQTVTEGGAVRAGIRVLEAFRADREKLLESWNRTAPAKTKSKVSLTEKREAKVYADLARWQRKLKLAQTKVKKLKQKAAYYYRAAAMRSKEKGDVS